MIDELSLVEKRIEFECPYCSNYYYGQERPTPDMVFKTVYYTDGTSKVFGNGCFDYLFITQCPSCHKIFDKKLLKSLTLSNDDYKNVLDNFVSTYKPSETDIEYAKNYIEKIKNGEPVNYKLSGIKNHIERRIKRVINEYKDNLSTKIKPNPKFGHIDYFFYMNKVIDTSYLYNVNFWKEMKKDLINTKEQYVESVYFDTLKNIQLSLWQSTHKQQTAKIPLEKYQEICKDTIPFFETSNENDKIILAEIFRNLGEFQTCLDLLEKIDLPKKIIEIIKQGAIDNNVDTLEFEDK